MLQTLQRRPAIAPRRLQDASRLLQDSSWTRTFLFQIECKCKYVLHSVIWYSQYQLALHQTKSPSVNMYRNHGVYSVPWLVTSFHVTSTEMQSIMQGCVGSSLKPINTSVSYCWKFIWKSTMNAIPCPRPTTNLQGSSDTPPGCL